MSIVRVVIICFILQTYDEELICELANTKSFVFRYTSRWGKGSVPRPPQTPNFIVSLKVGDKDFTGEGSTAQAAKHAAAAKALHLLKVSLILFATKTSCYYFGSFNVKYCTVPCHFC